MESEPGRMSGLWASAHPTATAATAAEEVALWSLDLDEDPGERQDRSDDPTLADLRARLGLEVS